MQKRCTWAKHPLEIEYHDKEWGVPVFDDTQLFEFLILDSFQAGLSWLTILKKRENFREAFDNFDMEKIASYKEDKVEQLIINKGIIRNKLKIRAAIGNAQAALAVRKEFGSLCNYFWQFTGYKTIVNRYRQFSEIPAETPESKAMSKDMKQRGFKFSGPTICYAFMQAAGMVNDHELSCFRYSIPPHSF